MKRTEGQLITTWIFIIATGVFIGMSAFHVLLPFIADVMLTGIEKVIDVP